MDEQWAALQPGEEMADGTVERFDAFTAAIEKRRGLLSQIKQQASQFRTDAAALALNEPLLKSGPRIEALQEQQRWLAALQAQVAETQAEIAAAETGLRKEQEQLGLGDRPMPSLSPQSLDALRRPAHALRNCRQKLDEAQRQVQEAEQTAASLGEKVESALTARGHKELGEATDRAGGLVAQLRRREQLDQRLEQMHRRHTELEQQTQKLMDREMLPVAIILGLGGVFIAGVVLVLLKLWEYIASTSFLGDLGWPLALLGLVATTATVVVKAVLEHSNARQIEASQRQTRMLQRQVEQVRQERDELDRQLPASGPAASGLQAAERELAGLEELVPVDAQRQAARREAQAAAQRAEQAETDLAAATRRWKEAVAAAGLPAGFAPKQVAELASRCRHLGHSNDRLQERRDENRQRSEELRGVTDRIAQLRERSAWGWTRRRPSSGCTLWPRNSAANGCNSSGGPRWTMRPGNSTASRPGSKPRSPGSSIAGGSCWTRSTRRTRRSFAAGPRRSNPPGRCAKSASRSTTRSRPPWRARPPRTSCADCSKGSRPQRWRPGVGSCNRGWPSAKASLRERLEKRGQLAEQLRLLAENRTPATKQLELATVQKRLRDAVRQWQVLGVTAQVLEAIRKGYEQTRQPECLQEASAHLRRMTEGRYCRVWTPLDDDVLLVDDAAGKPLSVEHLSHGVREQLFLSLRLALAGSYARRGPAADDPRRRAGEFRRQAGQGRGLGPLRAGGDGLSDPRVHVPRTRREALRGVGRRGQGTAGPRRAAAGRDVGAGRRGRVGGVVADFGRRLGEDAPQRAQ